MVANAAYGLCQQASHGLCLKYGVAVVMVVAHVAAWLTTTDQKAVHMPNVK
jgi:hypothetical protein